MLKKLKRAALGARVPHEKGTAGMETVKMPVPTKVVLPMQQHIGAPCTPVVKKGDTVQVGTLVGKAEGFVSANIYSGVSGTVTGVDSVRLSSGSFCPAVTGAYRKVERGAVRGYKAVETAFVNAFLEEKDDPKD